ncbi:hypothetical protein [Novosphingobium sp.]|uniref:hypothetical protein n=1 Tax=Novosphingobium sp. TaxID=1874826 RepID=UPI00286D9174|nr:hypothetical protein [Novosphingobium sp.]
MTAQDIDPLARSGPGADREFSDPAHLTVFIDDGSDAGAWASALSYAPYRKIADGVWTNGFVPPSVADAPVHGSPSTEGAPQDHV